MATDKRLDQVSTLTDFDYALIVKGDQVAKVTSTQLSSLITSMISKSSAMMNEIHSLYMRNNYSGDLDELGSGTFVFATGEATNLPNPGSAGFVFTTKLSNGYANQLFVNHAEKFMRTYIYNKWQNWQRIDNFGYNTLEELASGVAGQMKYNASKMVLDFRTSTTTDVTLPSYGMVLLSIVYGSELYGLYLIQCWDGVISIKTINESGTKKFQLGYNTYQKYITITSPSAVPSVRLGWINITD